MYILHIEERSRILRKSCALGKAVQSCANLVQILRIGDIYYKPSDLAIELNNLKAIAGKGLSLSSWCIASLYIYHFSTVVDFSMINI